MNGAAAQGIYSRARRVNGGRTRAGQSVMGSREDRRQDIRYAMRQMEISERMANGESKQEATRNARSAG